ncbi:hypothetical protein [Nocardia sp. alder85J]|uniref:hypothetical protein n=1 Tax=Nocardia sp. alder85J TaxID=2862949 RepID=UPI001CD3BDD2|nr:hypothetical protein [Nocardia sp. alder85J]MCX4095181.1 hypothetical protein [Nocardia sp. alder85J]
MIVAVLLVPIGAAGQPPVAQPPGGLAPPDTSSGADPLDPSSDYSVDLNTRIATFTATVAAWQQQGQMLAAQAQSLDARITAHNAVVDSYPGRTAPPSIADPLNEEAAALNSERDGLQGQITAWKEQATQLEAQRLALMQDIAHILHSEFRVVPPLPFRRAPGGDPGRAGIRNRLGQYSRGNGGDPASIGKEQAALDAYAKARNVQVITKQTKATLTPDGLAKLTPDEAAKLKTGRKFDGLVRKSNGNYLGLEVKSGTGGYQPGQEPFDDAIRRGGQAQAILDGSPITIDEVELVPG